MDSIDWRLLLAVGTSVLLPTIFWARKLYGKVHDVLATVRQLHKDAEEHDRRLEQLHRDHKELRKDHERLLHEMVYYLKYIAEETAGHKIPPPPPNV